MIRSVARPLRPLARLVLPAWLFTAALLFGCGTDGKGSCTTGEASCSCLPDGTCSGELSCGTDGKCAARTCPQGTEGCDCLADLTCAASASGAALACQSGKCVKAVCSLGSAGCACRTDGTCIDGTCSSGVCVAGDSAQPPAAAVCYTPCKSALTLADGTFVACPADGLMPRCLDGKSCISGSCVDPGAAAPGCGSDVDCPEFQACIQGACYSNCSSNADCSEGRACYRHACRNRCSATADSCPAGTACVTVDGTSGNCMPVRAAAGAPQLAVVGTFSLSSDVLAFSSSKLSGSIVLRNDAPVGLDFTVRKIDHTELTDSGQQVVTVNPLSWVAMGQGANAPVQQFTVFVDGNGGTKSLDFLVASNPGLARWEGRVEVAHPKIGKRLLSLTYVSRPDGRWAGKMYHFASFGESGLAAWMANRGNPALLGTVGNALVQRWGAFMAGSISYDEFQAVVTATLTESWRWASVQQICRGGEACYLYSNALGYSPYSSSLATYPIPTAVSELPVAMNLAADPADSSTFAGKVVTAQALQYGGDPAVTLHFALDPSRCKDGILGSCIAPLDVMSAEIRVGGRYRATSRDTTCSKAAAGTFTLAAIPWLVEGFLEGTERDPTTGVTYSYECRDTTLPFAVAAPGVNPSFAQSNPIPDGRTRVRRLELVDGALVNQDKLVVLFRERFDSFLGASDTDGFSAYGLMVLSRTPADLEASAFRGNVQADARPPPAGVLGTACAADIVEKVLGQGAAVSASNASSLAIGVLEGTPPNATAATYAPGTIHYLCHDNGLFDGGQYDDGSANIRVPCPGGSGATYFHASIDQATIAHQPCQQLDVNQKGSCGDTLQAWQANSSYGLVLDPIRRCSDSSQVYCDEDRYDLRSGKVFFQPGPSQPVFVPLATEIDNAFRYKTQFRSRTGTSVGFAPAICIKDSNAIPYCYDPGAIEEIRHRVDCAVDLYTNHYFDLDAAAQAKLKTYLDGSFGYVTEYTAMNGVVIHDGFEKLHAELLIMTGDEAYTSAFASRFDLAGARMRSFQGALFEPNGMNLAGAAGNEMFSFYQAAQYYQLALDRFYGQSPWIWQSIHQGDIARNFVSKETVVGYFDRLTRASTQKSRAWSEVAKRYQSFNRPDLARRVVERAYSAAYLESIVLSRLMLQVVNVSSAADRDFIVKRTELAALSYRAALLDMRDVYATISDSPTLFGYAPDFMPFPALDPGDVNAFMKLLGAAKQSVVVAATKEDAALNTSRAYDTDQAQFEAELVRLRNGYEDQLAQVCGTFTGQDGAVHPATKTYAYLDERARLMGDPCGLAGNGQLHDAMAQFELYAIDAKDVVKRYDDVYARIDIERERVNAQCNLNLELADYRWSEQAKVNDLQTTIRVARSTQGLLARVVGHAVVYAGLAKCTVGLATDCPTAVASAVAYNVVSTLTDVATEALEVAILVQEDRIANIQRVNARWETLHQCDVMRADSDAKVKELLLEVAHIDLEALKAQYKMKLALAGIQQLRNQATRLLAEQEEMEQQTINVAAAKNDPNIRIYKNDAVILADRTFELALQNAYKATKVYEYYTSQSYARLADLFLVRMVSHGDYNLETYLAELENAYRDFQQQFGNPDTRVEIISLRDDVVAVPRLDATGKAVSQADRIAEFRRRLTDASYLDERGYLTMPFSTTLARLSPLTRNHKVLAVEAEIIGSDLGDTVGRVYLRQRGTGMVLSVAGDRSYYRLPERTAVLNPLFNGVRVFSQDVYRSDRLRDRPFVNTHWELVLNQKDELANQDINLQSLTDVRLYVYYTDFTQL